MKSFPKFITIVIRLLFLVLVVYILFQAYAVINRGYKTETAIEYSMTDSVYVEGFLNFEQVPLTGDGILGYLVANGERVSAGTALAEVYESADQAKLRSVLQETDRQIELLEKSRNSTGDINLLMNQVQSDLVDVLDNLDRKDLTSLSAHRNNYLLSANKFQYTTGQTTDFSDLLKELEKEKYNLLNELGDTKMIYAGQSGYFVDSDHCNTLSYERETLMNMTPVELRDALEENQEKEDHESSLAGKIVTDYTWYFFGICDLRNASKFDQIDSVSVSVPGYFSQKIPANVVSLQVDEVSGLAAIVLECEYINAQLPTLTKAKVQIDFESYDGIRVPTSALHIVDGNRGVYVKYGNIVYFRKITSLYQNEDFILIPIGGSIGSENEVRLYDEIITEGNGLRNEKLL